MNMDRRSTREERLTVLRKFSQKLVDSSYSAVVCQEIFKSGLTRYFRLVLPGGSRRKKAIQVS